MRKFIAATFTLLLACVITACGSDNTGPAQPANTPDAPPERNEGILANVLAMIPDTPLFREHIMVDDLAARRVALGIELPGPDTPENEFWKYTGSLIRFPTDEHFVPITRDYGQLITGFPENTSTSEGIGFDVRNIDQSLHVRGNRDRRLEIVLGRFDPDLTDRLIAECQNCVPVERLSENGVSYYGWAVGDRSGDFRHSPPITDASGEGGYFWFTDSFAVRALHGTDMEALINLGAGEASSLLEDEDYALAASLLDRNGNLDATFSGKTPSFSRVLRDINNTVEYQGEHFNTVDDIEETLRGTGLLLPFQLYASAVRFEDGEFVVTSVLVHKDEQDAAANVERIRARIENGSNIRGDRWQKFIDSFDISASGRVVNVELRSGDSSVTFLRVSPTDVPWSLGSLYATIFTHEDVSGSESTLTPLPTPTPPLAPSPTPAPGTAVGEQEPACLDRGGAGSYRDGFNRIYLLMDPPEPGISDAQAVAQHLCIRGGTWVPDGRIIVRKADYSWADLSKWRSNSALYVDGVTGVGTDVIQNRISVDVMTPYVAEQLRKQIAASEIPLGAVIINVAKQFGLDDPPAMPNSEAGLKLSVSFDAEVELGEEVAFDVVLTNASDEPLEIEHGSPPEVDIVILTTDGTQVWRRLGGIRRGGGSSTEVRPGGEARFAVTWNQLDQDGFEVPAGDYLVRGFANVTTNDAGFVVRHNLSTAPVPVRIVER